MLAVGLLISVVLSFTTAPIDGSEKDRIIMLNFYYSLYEK
jgi:hypothetical protein